MSEMKVVRKSDLTMQTTQTPGMTRYDGISAKTVGAKNLWVGYVTLGPGVRSGAHHHGDSESAIYIISGRARFRFGDDLSDSIEASAGDFVHVPPHIVHQEVNASDSEGIEMIVSRDSQENVVVNVDLPAAVVDRG